MHQKPHSFLYLIECFCILPVMLDSEGTNGSFLSLLNPSKSADRFGIPATIFIIPGFYGALLRAVATLAKAQIPFFDKVFVLSLSSVFLGLFLYYASAQHPSVYPGDEVYERWNWLHRLWYQISGDREVVPAVGCLLVVLFLIWWFWRLGGQFQII